MKSDKSIRGGNVPKEGFSGAVGNTPLIVLPTLSLYTKCQILGKAEWMNPGLSVKDRASLNMIKIAEEEGKLKKGDWLVEATAGNTGVALAHIALAKGYKTFFACPNHASEEKVQALKSLGAQVKICPKVPLGDPEHFQSQAKAKAKELGGFYTNQFWNENNWKAHYNTTGPEIWEQTGGKINGIVLASGTGGTIKGTSDFLREKDPDFQCYLIDIPGSSVTLGDYDPQSKLYNLRDKTHQEKDNQTNLIEGIGSSTTYLALQQTRVNGIFYIPAISGIKMCHYLLKKEGIFIGGSSGINMVGACLLAKKLGPGNTVASFLCDNGRSYSSKIFNPEWLKNENFEIGDVEDLSFLKDVETLNGIV